MLPNQLDTLKPDEEFLSDLGKNVWLMNDHRWAFLVWEKHRSSAKYCLVHADHHWDAVYDFQDSKIEEAALITADIRQLESYVAENKLIRYDSFIAPAVRRGLFAEVHFFCKEDDGNEVGLDKELLIDSATVQVIHKTTDSLASNNFRCPIIFDLCLDLFNKSEAWETGDLWTDSEITNFLISVQHLVRSAEMVTVSLSFGYSGSEDDTRKLAKLVLPQILAARGDT